MVEEADLQKIKQVRAGFIAELGAIQKVYQQARAIVDAYPESDGARVLNEMLIVGGESNISSGVFPGWDALA